MVTNLPVEAKVKWSEAVACRLPSKKIQLMREFISLVPKHKGTSKLLVNVRRRIASLEEELTKEKMRKKGSRGKSFSIPKVGAGQIIILGPTNVGRSSLLTSITNAKVEITPVCFSTHEPVIGMFQFEDIQFQLIEAPSLVEGSANGKMNGPKILGLARNADGLVLMVDLAKDPIKQFKLISSELEQAGIIIRIPEGEVEIIRRSIGMGIQVIGGGTLVNCAVEDIKKLLNSYKIISGLVKIKGKIRIEDVENSLFSSNIFKPTIIIANKLDLPVSKEKIKHFKKYLENYNIPVLEVSCEDNQGFEKLGNIIFQILSLVRVYTKEPNAKNPSKKPVVVEKGAAIIDVAKKLHTKLYKKFKYARIWGTSAKHPGQKVGSNHILEDNDIIEIH
jgi:ribosome-interacting GTPase 1